MVDEKRKRIEEDLDDLESYIKEFSDFLPLAVLTVSPLGMIISANKAIQELTGYLCFESVGLYLSDLFLEKEKIKEIEKKIEKEGSFLNQELTLIGKDEKRVPVNVFVSSRNNRQGEYVGFFTALINISEIKTLQQNLEEKVKARTRELEQRIDELERFHDLTVGRELKMLELKKEIKRLKNADQTRSQKNS